MTGLWCFPTGQHDKQNCFSCQSCTACLSRALPAFHKSIHRIIVVLSRYIHPATRCFKTIAGQRKRPHTRGCWSWVFWLLPLPSPCDIYSHHREWNLLNGSFCPTAGFPYSTPRPPGYVWRSTRNEWYHAVPILHPSSSCTRCWPTFKIMRKGCSQMAIMWFHSSYTRPRHIDTH